MPETMDKKEVQQQPSPGEDSASKAERFRLLARGWVVLLGVSWGGTLAHLLAQVSWLGSANVPLGNVHVSAGALAAGALLAAGIIVGIFKKLASKMVYNRPGLGRAVRLSAFGGVAGLVLFGSYALYMAPSISSSWWRDVFGPWSLFGKMISVKPILFPAAGVFLGVMAVVFLLLNQDKWADFLIETEGEVKKVSWPARREFVGSAAIVVGVVAVVSMFLHFVDKYLSLAMQKLGVGF
jgi:preprotein translocase SecE subunit